MTNNFFGLRLINELRKTLSYRYIKIKTLSHQFKSIHRDSS